MKLTRLSYALRANAAFAPGWQAKSADVILCNPLFGSLQHVALCDESGQPIYDQPIWAERTGAICVAIDSAGQLALLRHVRPVLLAQGATVSLPLPIESISGRVSLEFPRGFPHPDESPAAAAARETAEETGFAVVETIPLGRVNTNTSFFPNSNEVFLVRIDRHTPAAEMPDKTEQTLYCDMEAEQRRTYEELRIHYRDALLKKDAAELNRDLSRELKRVESSRGNDPPQ